MSSEIKEIAIKSEPGGMAAGTGSYTLKVQLNRSIPIILPMHGLKIKCTYQGVKKQCDKCYEYHRINQEESRSKNTCEKKTLEQYIAIFKDNNPQIPVSMINCWSDEDEFGDEEDNSDDFPERSNNTDEDLV